MSLLTDGEFDGDHAEMVADLPGTFTLSAKNYQGMISPIAKGTILETAAGLLADIDFEINIETSKFKTRPVAGNLVTIANVEYRIVSVQTDEADIALNLFCAEKTA